MAAALIGAMLAQAGLLAQKLPPPSPPQQTTEVITVSARDAEVIATAINTMRSSRDQLVAKTVADNIIALTDALSSPSRVFQIGPLTKTEQRVVDLEKIMTEHAISGGPIRIRVRGPESTHGDGKVWAFTRSSFIAFCADIASSPTFQVRTIQENKMIVAARMIADLNEQLNGLVPERETLIGALLTFENLDRKGVIIDRVLAIGDVIAARGSVYELVPTDLAGSFGEFEHMDVGVFEVNEQAKPGLVNLRYDGRIYTTSVNHFVWFFLRFLLTAKDRDEATRMKRLHFGGQLLDYLSLQLNAEKGNVP